VYLNISVIILSQFILPKITKAMPCRPVLAKLGPSIAVYNFAKEHFKKVIGKSSVAIKK